MKDINKAELPSNHYIVSKIKDEIIKKYEKPKLKKDAEFIAKKTGVSASTIQRLFGISNAKPSATYRKITLGVFTESLFGKKIEEFIDENRSEEEDLVAHIFDKRYSKLLNIYTRQNFYTFDLLCHRLELSPEIVDNCIKNLKGFRVRYRKNSAEDPLSIVKTLEYFEDNTDYGTFLPAPKENQPNNITIINPIGYAEKNITFVAHYLAQYTKGNYIANEKFSKNATNYKKRLAFVNNPAYQNDKFLDKCSDKTTIFQNFCKDLDTLIKEDTLVVILQTAKAKRSHFHIVFGGNENKYFGFNFPEMTFNQPHLLENELEKLKQTLTKDNLTLVTHEELGNVYDKDSLHYHIHQKYKANILTIYLNIAMISYTNLFISNEKIIRLLGDFLVKLL